MSYITDVTMVVRDPYPDRILDHVQTFTWENRSADFGRLDTNTAGGSKVYCDRVYAAAFNYLPVADFLDHLAAAPWNLHSHSVVLLATEGSYYSIFRPGEPVIEESYD